jgi:hypothetical protein
VAQRVTQLATALMQKVEAAVNFIPVCSVLLRMYYKYIYDVSPHLLSQHCVYFTILHPLSSQHVSAPRAIIR